MVNVASECGYTHDNYQQLVQLQNEFAYTKQFTVLAFPCNQFGKQEPGVSTGVLFRLITYPNHMSFLDKVDHGIYIFKHY